MQFLYLGGHPKGAADVMKQIERRIRLARACYDRS